jgi:hypothetical protein
MKLRLCAAFMAFATVFGPAAARAEEPFYKGKRLVVMINFAAAGPTDIEGRLFAKFLAKHLAGKPTVIVQNMDGAGGAIGTGYLGEVAPRDGTMLGYLSGTAWRHVSLKEKSRVDFLTYSFVAYQPGTTVYYVRKDAAPGLQTSGDVVKATDLVVGGLSGDSSKDLLLRLTSDMLGLKYKYVTGYKSNTHARLAFDRGEISLFAESPPAYRSVVEPGPIASGQALPLFYNPGWNGTRFATPSQVKGLAMPSFDKFYEQVKGKPPEGRLWEAYKQVLAVSGAMQRIIAFPPESPAAAVRDVQAALARFEADAEYAAEASRLLGFVPDYEAGPNVQEEVRRALSVPREDREWLEDYARRAGK